MTPGHYSAGVIILLYTGKTRIVLFLLWICYFYFIALSCGMRTLRESLIAHDGDYEKAYQTSLINCISTCQGDANCKAAYYVHGFCFIVYKDARLINYLGSSYFEKVCNFTYRKYDIIRMVRHLYM